jgi:hypothetical protein
MDGWNIALLAVAGYVAVLTLSRLMAARRNEITAQFRREVEKEKNRREQTPPLRRRSA